MFLFSGLSSEIDSVLPVLGRLAAKHNVFAIGTNGVLRHRWWDGKRWVEWRDVAGAPSGGRAVACVWSGRRLDVFVWGADGGLHYADLA